MADIFMDESGDMGFDFRKKKTSSVFIVTFLFVKTKPPVEKIVKKIFRDMPKQDVKHHSGVLHAYKEKPATRMKVLELLSQQDISILTIYLNKKKVYTKLHDEKHVLYNYVTNILIDRICTKKLVPTDKPIRLIASRRETNKFLNENFKSYLENQTRLNHKLRLGIEIKTPHQEKCLQAADMICWAIYRKHEHGDKRYYDLFKDKIIEEQPLFP